MNKKYTFPLSIQTLLPEDYKSNDEFKKDLELLQSYNFTGVELNIAYPEKTDYSDLITFLAGFDLKMTKFASGLTAKTFMLSLSSDDIIIRNKAVEKIKEVTSLMKGVCDGIILGFFKGRPVEDKTKARKLFKDSLMQIAPHAEKNKVSLIIEATNYYESSVANTLDDTFELFNQIKDNKYVKMLPDTFHMNIGEVDIFAGLDKYFNYYDSIHISDNNRFYPGFGAIDFKKIIEHLKKISFAGGIAIEGNTTLDFRSDVKRSMEYLIPLLSD